MKHVLFIIALLIGISTYSQTYKEVNGQLVKVDSTKTKDIKTTWTVTKKDVKYPVFKSARGKFYIIRTSKNTGKKYKQYIKIEGKD